VRLLRRYGKAIGVIADFTIHDRSDSEDLMHLVREELGLVNAPTVSTLKATTGRREFRAYRSESALGVPLR